MEMSDAEKLKRYKIFDQHLQRINKNLVNPNGRENELVNKCAKEFIQEFRSKLYQIEPFLENYKEFHYVGSVSEGLAVGKTYKEFDVNILISDTNIIKRENIEMSIWPGWVMLKATMEPNYESQCQGRVKVFKKWTGDDGYIVPFKFYCWGEGVMDRLANSIKVGDTPVLQCRGNKYRYRMTKSGPAFKLHVKMLNGYDITFDVDIVFALSFDRWPFDWPSERWSRNRLIDKWVVVAKRSNNMADVVYTLAGDCNWRYSFPRLEKEILHDGNHLKNTVRLIKQIRDKNDMPYIASYYIKNLFISESETVDRTHWNQSMGYLFVTMLEKFLTALKNRRIDFFFDKRSNLLSNLTDGQLKNATDKIENVLEEVYSFCDNGTPERINELFQDDEQPEPISDSQTGENSLCAIM